MNPYVWFIEPLTDYGFMRYGLAAAVIVGVATSLLSCLLVVRHQALMGDAISHAVLPGVVVGYLVAETTGVFIGALIVAMLSGVAITYVERNSEVELDAVMGIVFTATFALGLAILSVARPRGIDLNHILFGNVLGVATEDVVLTGVTGAVVVLVIAVGFRWFHLWSFDPVTAAAVGLPTGLIHYVFTLLLSAVIVASLQAVGLILVVAMLITPGATARLLTTRLSAMMRVSVSVGVLSAVAGLYGSFYVDVASGPAIVLSATLCFIVAFLFAPRGGVVAKRFQRRRRARQIVDEDVIKALFDESNADRRIPVAALVAVARRDLTWSHVRHGDEIDGEVNRSLERLVAGGLIDLDGSGAPGLTSEGRTEALRLVRAHRLIEQYSHEADGVPIDELHEVAEALEHRLDGAELDDYDLLLGSPDVDPHGHPIPSRTGELAIVSGAPLSQAPIGAVGTVTMIADDRSDLLHAMVGHGILPGSQLVVHRVTASEVELGIGRACAPFPVPRELADRVYVALGEQRTEQNLAG